MAQYFVGGPVEAEPDHIRSFFRTTFRMNRFRTKKRAAKEEAAAAAAAAAPRPSQDSESSMPFRPFRKGKKQPENEKIEVDISAALPSNDDFRTSLLMSGLSARFSMLREQDDPNTKIGKASDDSVLFPKRQSRLDFAALRGLGDIAEVESIKAAAPFARADSYHSDDADSLTGASVMSRAKPSEGNNLFGGRQKIYKIPVGASSSRTVGMGGRALYEDDVSMSAFQKWRQSEKERTSSDEDRNEARAEAASRLSGNVDTESQRAESPFLGGWNRKRETSSTTSSVPSLARNSTAATSVTSSQPTASMKDWQPNSTTPTTTNSSTPLERNVTRTRRLYETGLNHDLQEQQSSALSRFESLTRQRTFGTRTPDLPPTSNSPTAAGFKERLNSDRKILAKASAPNLRSMSPPATASSAGTSDLGVRVPSRTEGKSPYGGIPPVSPPVSESEDSTMFPIQPNDRGKATALGVFQKPAQPYDESKYAQRQIQLQQGRETPTQRHRPDSKDSWADNASRSSSTQRQVSEPKRNPSLTQNQPPFKDDIATSSFLLGDDSESSPAVSPKPILSPQLVVQRPSDKEHPAFRSPTMPTPSIVASNSNEQSSPDGEGSPSRAPNPKGVSPVDSPTLGPTTGLSGMVRQHLRVASNASSIYSTVPLVADLDGRFPAEPEDANNRNILAGKSNPWDMQSQDWDAGLETSEPMVDDGQSAIIPTETENRDEFASQLADGARRIRERLTSYAETDSRSSSPQRAGEHNDSLDLQPPQTNGFGMLRAKGSQGSLIDRGRDQSQSKAMKMLGIGGRSYSPAASRKGSVEVTDITPTASERSEPEGTTNGGGEAHAGIRAFRQARRDLQRHKEQETESKHQTQTQGPLGPLPGIPASRVTPPEEYSKRRGSPSRERKPAPSFFQQRMHFEESAQNGSRSGSRDRDASREDRNRSGSESSNGGYNGASRFRNFTSSREEQQLAPSHPAQRPKLRSPGLPGTDIKNSPIMPPMASRGPSPARLRTNLPSSDNLHARYPHGQPSPISPIPSPLSASGRSMPGGFSSGRRPSVPQSPGPDTMGSNGSGYPSGMRRKLSTKDISEPTLLTSTHVPTITLPHMGADDRSRTNSRSVSNGNSPPRGAPPLPPINPRRRHENSQPRSNGLPGGMI